MLLFGTEDKVTQRTLSHYPDEHVEDNIVFKHAYGASHITPCMQDYHQLRKLEPMIGFMEKNPMQVLAA